MQAEPEDLGKVQGLEMEGFFHSHQLIREWHDETTGGMKFWFSQQIAHDHLENHHFEHKSFQLEGAVS